jgi:hypothetical protein
MLYAGLVLGVWVVFGLTFQTGTIHIDNFSGRDLRLELDGKPWLSSSKQTTVVQSLRHGSYQLVVRGTDGKELDRLSIRVEGSSVYVLNLLGAQTYTRGHVHYGLSFGFGGGDSAEKIADRWFEPKVDYLFEAPPQKVTVRVRKGSSGLASATKSYLRRGAPAGVTARP